jgi:hypothetical protein
MKLFLSQIFLYMLLCIASLCVGCRSSRTGSAKTALNSHSERSQFNISDTYRSSLFDFSYIKTDPLRIHITEYFPPAAGDTASRGPVKSEADIAYGGAVTADSSVITGEHIRQLDGSDEDTVTSLTEESRKETAITPWYADWQFILASVAAVAIIAYIILRRMHIV